ncbi:MAG: 4a-hydroxytetrahydrobiopterin dehydratase [bacterium]|nr:4a-hydroxytetrahydrobiopterin dehydratase [bacterium]
MATPLVDQVLDGAATDEALARLAGWRREGKTIHKVYKFGSFMESVEFVNRVAKAAEAMDHHPDITISYDEVGMTLSTHKHDAVTQADIALARRIEEAA